jgi:hypothetical protein
MEQPELPGSRHCVGCEGLTFRNRADGLCPRCAFEAEHLIEQIELDGLERDLTLMTRFEAYCRARDEARARPPVRELFPAHRVDLDDRPRPFESGTWGKRLA